MLVDVGGGEGHDLKLFLERFPEAKGSLVLQDLPAVVNGGFGDKTPPGVISMSHDFFDAQPVKGKLFSSH
jgi:hypothetical protein